MSAALIMGAVNTAALTHRAVTSVCVLLVKSSIGTRKTVLVSPPFIPRLEISHNVCRFHGNAPRLSLRGGKMSSEWKADTSCSAQLHQDRWRRGVFAVLSVKHIFPGRLVPQFLGFLWKLVEQHCFRIH